MLIINFLIQPKVEKTLYFYNSDDRIEVTKKSRDNYISKYECKNEDCEANTYNIISDNRLRPRL